MTAQFKQMFLDKGVKGRPGIMIVPKALVIHWTANTNVGADAVANRNYFNSGVAASAHYIVDDKQIIQCLPESEMAYHVGSKGYTQRALDKLSPYPNNCTIGIEMCVNSDGDFSKTYQNTIELAADILKRHNWNIDKLWRHYDVTGKDCPRFFVNNVTARQYGFASAKDGWEKFKSDVKNILIGGNGMTDFDKHWAKSDIEFCMSKGIFAKTDKFRPDDSITRAEVAVIVQRLINLINGGK